MQRIPINELLALLILCGAFPVASSPISSSLSERSFQPINSVSAFHTRRTKPIHMAIADRSRTTIPLSGQNCGTSPINSDCDFDILQDEQIGTIDATTYPDFDRLYATTANFIIADDVPTLSDGDDVVPCGRGQNCKRQTAPMSLYKEVLFRFQKVSRLTSASNVLIWKE